MKKWIILSGLLLFFILTGCSEMTEEDYYNMQTGRIFKEEPKMEKLNIHNYIGACLQDLKELGIDVTAQAEEIENRILQMPSDILADMLADWEKEEIAGMMFDIMKSEQIYSFDVEVDNPGNMYRPFLEKIETLTKGDLTFCDIKEMVDEKTYEAGEGDYSLSFSCNGKSYEYTLRFEYDWFDTEILSYLNAILEEEQSENALYAGSDGLQNCIVFYNTEEWARQFNERMDLQIEKP